MGCTTCGGNGNCGCANCNSSVVGNPVQVGGCCQPLVQANPTPYYNCAPACPESHTQRVVIQQFYMTVPIANSWNIPDCGDNAIVTVVGLKSALIGGYIWNETYGFFEITAFDSGTGQLTLLNHCNTGNAAAGTEVPACTDFGATVPPCDCGSTDQPCVAIDFTAPSVNVPTDITLSSTNGLTVSDTIQIGSGFYFLQEIKPNNVVTIINKGDGITPGTSVIALDNNGNYQYCLSVTSTNPCDRPDEESVILTGCNSDGVTVPLECITVGWVPTRIPGDSNELACRPVGVATECTTLTAQFNLVNGTANYTLVAVADSSPFQVGDTIEFEGGQWGALITGLATGTLNLTVMPTPSFNTHISNGTTLCLQNCCDQVLSQVAELSSLAASSQVQELTPITIDTGSPTHDTAHLTWSVVNPSLTKTMKVLSVFNFNCNGVHVLDISATDPAYDQVDVFINFKVNGGSTVSIEGSMGSYLAENADEVDQSIQLMVQRTDIIPVNSTYTFEAWGTITWSGGVLTSYQTEQLTVSQSHLGTAL